MIDSDIQVIRDWLSSQCVTAISAETGIPRKTIYNIIQAKHDTGYKKLIRLQKYMEQRK